MSQKAKAGYAAYCRQDFIGADYGLVNYTTFEPSPDYWLLLLWKRLVGQKVLSVDQPLEATTRAYAFCSTPSAPTSLGSAVLVLINLAEEEVCYSSPEGTTPGSNLIVYTLTPGAGGVESSSILFNGVPLALDSSGKVPAIIGKAVPSSDGITLPPLSVVFVLLPIQDLQVCT